MAKRNPSGAKAPHGLALYGTAEAVPFQGSPFKTDRSEPIYEIVPSVAAEIGMIHKQERAKPAPCVIM